MFWVRIRFLAVATLAVGIAGGGSSVYVAGSQEQAPKDGQPVSKRPTTKAAKAPQTQISREATELPATSTPRTRLRVQQLSRRKAKATYEIARLTRELAEIAVEEYEEVNYPRDLAIVDGELKLAESDLSRSDDRLQWAKRMLEKKYITPAQKLSEELTVKKARFALEQAQSKRKVLVDYTRAKAIKQLKSEVEKARSDELAKQAAWEVAEFQEIDLEHQLRLKTN